MKRGAAAVGGFAAVVSALTAVDRPTPAALAALAAVAVVALIVGAVCWVVADPVRARNLALLIHVALRGGPPR